MIHRNCGGNRNDSKCKKDNALMMQLYFCP